MDLAQMKKILEAHGQDKCLQIIFDNGRVWLTSKPRLSSDETRALRGYNETEMVTLASGKTVERIVFDKFSDLVRINEDRETVTYIERQHGTDVKTRQKMYWEIENPIEGIQGFAFVPPEMSEEDEYILRKNWDVTLT